MARQSTSLLIRRVLSTVLHLSNAISLFTMQCLTVQRIITRVEIVFTDWDKKISKIDVNNTLSLYEGEEKKFDEEIKRDKFWLNIRIRPNIGYGVKIKSGFCFFNSFFKSLIKANVINISKHKIIKDSSYIYKYNENIHY